MSSVFAFLQARMGSTRLPGKVLLQIQGQSMLERAIRRLQAAEAVDAVAVLTTELPADNAVVELAEALGVLAFRGPEFDVLKRYQLASDYFRPEIIIRATADNPLIDIGSVDRIVRALRASDLDYCVEIDLPVGAATEAITAQALRRVDALAEQPWHREHVTLYIKENSDSFRVAFLAPPDVLRHPDLRLTVDTPADFIFIEDIIQGVADSSRPLPLERYLARAAALGRSRL